MLLKGHGREVGVRPIPVWHIVRNSGGIYLQASRGEWIRRQHQLLSLLVSIVTAFAIACVAILINLVFWDDLASAPDSFRALVGHLPIFFVLIAVLVLLLRVAGFIGGRTLLRLLTGYYHRPVIEQRVLAFVDVKDSAQSSNSSGLCAARKPSAVSSPFCRSS